MIAESPPAGEHLALEVQRRPAPQHASRGGRRAFLAALCAYAFLQGAVVTGMEPSAVTSIEERYGFSSFTMGYIIAAYDFLFVVVVLPIALLGASHRPRACGVGLAVYGLGAIVFSLPQFATDDYVPETALDGLCRLMTGDVCTRSSSYSGMLGIFVLAQLLLAAGAAPIWTLGIAHLSDLYEKHVLGGALAWFYAFAALGPAAGFGIAGSIIQSVFVEPGDAPRGLDADDESWIGAWWLPFILAGILCFPVAVMFFFFPRETPGRDVLRKRGRSQSNEDAQDDGLALDAAPRPTTSGEEKLDASPLTLLSQPRLADFWTQAREIFRMPAWNLNVAATAIELFVNTGFSTFFAKFMETQYGISQGRASLLAGALVVPGGVLGLVFGGYCINRFQLNIRQAARFAFVTALVAFLIIPVFFLGCDNQDIVGVTVNFQDETLSDAALDNECNADCSCDARQRYQPVCGDDGLTYYNPCVAGCLTTVDDGASYEDCSCNAAGDGPMGAEDGSCDGECPRRFLLIFCVALLLVMFATFASNGPASFVNLRLLGERRATFGIALQSLLIRLFGTVPGPIVMGALLDQVCLQSREVCDVEGACEIYDARSMRMRFVTLGLVGKGLSTLCYYLSYRYAPNAT